MGPSALPPHLFPVNYSEAYDLVSQHVQVLLNSAQHFIKAKGRRSQAYENVQRGPKRIKTGLDTLKEAEYIYGLFRLIKDPRTPHNQKSPLSKHLHQVFADAKY